MKFLIDRDVYAVTTKFLADNLHDVVVVRQLGLSEAKDEEVLKAAQELNRILVTRDRHYGNLIFVRALGAVVIYLRILLNTINSVHSELARVLQTYSEQELTGAFVVVEPNGYRFRRLFS